jgi:hypothetical protein
VTGPPDRGFELVSEFASVRVELDESANGPRLRILDGRTGAYRYLDPLVLEALIWASEDDMRAIVDPAARWTAESSASET